MVAPEAVGVRRGALADHGELDARRVESLPVALQLQRVLAAEQSAVVAQEGERGGAIGPQAAEPHVAARVVLEHDVRELVGRLRRVRALARGGRPENALLGPVEHGRSIRPPGPCP